MTVAIAQDFSRVPAGRYLADGEFSGERFRDSILIPALEKSEVVTIQLDGAAGYGSSFLEEAFGGLVRKGFAASELRKKLDLRAVSAGFVPYKDAIWQYIDEASRSISD